MGDPMSLKLCTICARGGSKGVKNKNIRLLLDKPLISYSIAQAKQAGIFDAVAVSSDSEDILRISKEYGADYLIRRPAHLASDTAAKIPSIQHCVRETERMVGKTYDIIVDLDATSPLRIPDDIVHAVDLLEQTGASNVITGMPSRRSPYFNLVEIDGDGKVVLSKLPDKPVVRRQDAPQCYDMNVSIYVWQRDALFYQSGLFHDNTRLYVMPEERSIDIDSELDFEIVEMIMKKRVKA